MIKFERNYGMKHTAGKQHAENEFERYRPIQDSLFESDFDKTIKQIENE